MSDEEFEQKLATTHDKISSQSCESCSKWCEEFVNVFGCSSDCETASKNDTVTILQKSADSGRSDKESNSSKKLLADIRAILLKEGTEACTQTNECVEGRPELMEKPEVRKTDLTLSEAQLSIVTLLKSLQQDQELIENSEKNYESHLRQSRKRSKSKQAKGKCKGENDTESRGKSTDKHLRF